MYNKPSDPYVVKLKRGPAFGVENWSAPTKKEALDFAASFCSGDPDWVKVVNRKGKVIYSFKQIQAKHEQVCKELGITEFTFGVSVNMKGGQFQTTIVPL